MKRRSLWLAASLLALMGLDLASYRSAIALPGEQDKSEIAVTTGEFHKVAHNTKGTATIYELPDGSRELRIRDLDTASGPALYVYLVKAEDVKDSRSVRRAGFIDLGKLKTRKGDSAYAVPKDIDLWQYLSVTIWCKRHSVNFGTAPLKAAGK